ncbi:DUF2243 domain-containing protein [Pontibacter qinzhouensis]|uniref:DUF2243 domain-containing protein n=1 Tax=Pontibacter qinzhouensis TaxID=2603253 RepID=A0A5C8K6F9_9BACT|nr:DUF2243 domain-containing protein [Pontibacter qinzhouensis]TXK45855.1 DUF2243 domain-containing protein [Pontibacter qinzhouensis]
MNQQVAPHTKRRSMQAAALVGVGVMAAVDEIIFHQILAWHHFYDRSTTEVGLMTDGLLHAAELIAVVAGFFMLLDLRRQDALVTGRAWAWFFLGLGSFQLFDGIVDHKVLRLHQIRYVENLLPYDISWNAAGLLLLLIGLYLWRKAKLNEMTNTGI